MSKSKLPEISFSIAACLRVDFPACLLDSLNCRTVSKEAFEIVVVDNTPVQIHNVESLYPRQTKRELSCNIDHAVVEMSTARNSRNCMPYPCWSDYPGQRFSISFCDAFISFSLNFTQSKLT